MKILNPVHPSPHSHAHNPNWVMFILLHDTLKERPGTVQ